MRNPPASSAGTRTVRAVAALAAGTVAILCGGCSGSGALQQPPTLGMLVALLGGTVVLNALVMAALLLVWEGRTHRRAVREALLRELRHLAPLASEEGVVRKSALLRELNALGTVPEALDGLEMGGADLRGVRLGACSLRGANLAEADLQGAVLDGADLFGATLTGANLALAGLRGANLRGADLTGAGLIKAQLAGANLHRAELVNADLHGAMLSGARLTLARFASSEPGVFQPTVHASVDDWIRARLDAEGRYREDAPAPDALPEAG